MITGRAPQPTADLPVSTPAEVEDAFIRARVAFFRRP